MKKLLLTALVFSSALYAVTANKVWRIPTGGTVGAWGPIDLADTTNAVTGVLPGSSLGTNPLFSGTNAQVGTLPIVVSPQPATSTSLIIYRGTINAACTTSQGEGFSTTGTASNTTGCTMSLSPAGGANVTCVATSIGTNAVCWTDSGNSSSVKVTCSGAANFNFMCAVPR